MSLQENQLAILIPAYNEEDRIRPTLEEYLNYFKQSEIREFLILVILNGCRDNTSSVVQSFQSLSPHIQLLDIKDPIGKGGALIEGMKKVSNSDVICYVDADGSTSPKALHQLINTLKKNSGYDLVVGSRWLNESVLHQSQTLTRRIASRVFHVVVQLLFGMGIKDTQCPAKVARGELVMRVIPKLSIADLAFDVNFLFSAYKENYRIVERPTEWTDVDGSTVTRNLVRASLVMFLSVVRLRLIYSPFYKWLAPIRPIEQWLYLKLGGPPSQKS